METQNIENIYTLRDSTRKDKKYMVIDPFINILHFGQRGAEDYTIHKDEERKKKYIIRHQKRETKHWAHNKQNIKTPSYWSRFLLWEVPDM